jgi:hypothetical protein
VNRISFCFDEQGNPKKWGITEEQGAALLRDIKLYGIGGSPPSKGKLGDYSLPPRGNGHNAAVPGFIRTGKNYGHSRGEIWENFQREYQPNPGEDIHTVFEHAWETITSTSSGKSRKGPKWPETDIALQQSIIRRLENITLENLKSPDDVNMPAGEILGRIFEDDEFVCMGESVRFARTLLWRNRENFEMPLYVPSPMTAEKGSNKKGDPSHRCSDNTGSRRVLVIEFDGLPNADDQIRLHHHLSTLAPLVYVAHSGGKSYHGGYWCEGQDEEKLGQFMEYAVRLGADYMTFTLCQLVRIPNGIALDKEGQPRQRVCFLDLGKIGSTDWHFDRIPSHSGLQLFPLHCLPLVAERMAREMARVTTAQNEALAAAVILGTLSASLGAGLEVSTVGGQTVRGNLFILAIAESGTGKGENFNHATASFKEIETEAIQQWESATKPRIVSELAIADKRAKKLCEAAANAVEVNDADAATRAHTEATTRIAELTRQLESCPRFRVADVTKEALAVAMQAQPGQAIASHSSEARGIFSIVKGRYGKEGGDEDLYCSGYSGDPLTVDRLGRPRVTLHRPCLSILWMIQPDAARRAFADASLMESGMLPRFLFFDPKAEPKERFGDHAPISAEVRMSWNKCVSSLLETYRSNGDSPRIVRPSEDAVEVMADFERETVRRRQRAGDLADVAAFVARWSENAWRLALVLHAATHQDEAHEEPLTIRTAKNAVEIVRWFAVQQLEVLRWGRQEKLKNRLLALLALLAILANGSGEISFRDLRRSHAFGEEEIRKLHSLYPQEFAIEKKKGDKGRSSMVVKSNG